MRIVDVLYLKFKHLNIQRTSMMHTASLVNMNWTLFFGVSKYEVSWCFIACNSFSISLRQSVCVGGSWYYVQATIIPGEQTEIDSICSAVLSARVPYSSFTSYFSISTTLIHRCTQDSCIQIQLSSLVFLCLLSVLIKRQAPFYTSSCWLSKPHLMILSFVLWNRLRNTSSKT